MTKVTLIGDRLDLGLIYEKGNGREKKAIKKAALFRRLFKN